MKHSFGKIGRSGAVVRFLLASILKIFKKQVFHTFYWGFVEANDGTADWNIVMQVGEPGYDERSTICLQGSTSGNRISNIFSRRDMRTAWLFGI